MTWIPTSLGNLYTRTGSLKGAITLCDVESQPTVMCKGQIAVEDILCKE